MKNLATLLLLTGAISSVVARPAPLSSQPQHVDRNSVEEVSADLAPDYTWIADLNATQTSDEEGKSSRIHLIQPSNTTSTIFTGLFDAVHFSFIWPLH